MEADRPGAISELVNCFLFLGQNCSVFLICKMGIVIEPFPFGLSLVLNKRVRANLQAQCEAMVTVQFLVAIVDIAQTGWRHSLAGFWRLLWGIVSSV